MLEDPLYVSPLLANLSYHNLDETGRQVKPENIVDRKHSLSNVILKITHERKYTLNRGKAPQDMSFHDEVDSITWAGPVRWFRGTLQVAHGNAFFPPGRELLFYHRSVKEFHCDSHMLPGILQDMMKYGYLLPRWIPLLSREMSLDSMKVTRTSTVGSLANYMPYKNSSLTKLKCS